MSKGSYQDGVSSLEQQVSDCGDLDGAILL